MFLPFNGVTAGKRKLVVILISTPECGPAYQNIP